MSIRLSHIAIAVPEIETVVQSLEAISLEIAERHEVPTEKVKVAMIPVAFSDRFRIELVEPTQSDSPIAKFLERSPRGGMHHLCFEVSELEKWQTVLETKGIAVLSPGIRQGARGRVLFIHPKSMGGVLIELEEFSSQ